MPAVEAVHKRAPAQTPDSHKATFFRQGGWMMISAVGAGALMFAVQIFSKKFLSDPEYSSFAALIQVTNWITIPALGLQMVFAQQTAAAVTDEQHRQLVGTVRAVMLWTFCIWLATVATAIIYRHQWIAALKLSNPMSLWITIAVGLFMIWMQIFQGLLQGRQNFLWFGWANVANGIGRVVIGGLIIIKLGGQCAGLMLGVLMGMVAAFGSCFWQNMDLLKSASAKFDATGWLKRVVPLTLGFGASTFLFSADAIVVQNYLGANGAASNYMFGATLCRAIVLFTVPLAAVMFPKLVHSAAHSQKSNVMGLTMIGTIGLSLLAVVGLAVVSPFIMKYFAKPTALPMDCIPLFGMGMVPLGSGNVLLYNLMAHSRFKIVPALLALAVGYWIALQHFHDSFRMVVQTFCIFTTVYFVLCALFTWVFDRGHGVVREPVVDTV